MAVSNEEVTGSFDDDPSYMGIVISFRQTLSKYKRLGIGLDLSFGELEGEKDFQEGQYNNEIDGEFRYVDRYNILLLLYGRFVQYGESGQHMVNPFIGYGYFGMAAQFDNYNKDYDSSTDITGTYMTLGVELLPAPWLGISASAIKQNNAESDDSFLELYATSDITYTVKLMLWYWQ